MSQVPATWMMLALLVQVPSPAPVEVQPGEIGSRRDLIGKEVVVDDRVKMFWPSPDRTYNEILLKRANVSFRLPRQFRYDSLPLMGAARIRGIVREEGSSLVVDVTARPQLYKDDLARLKLELEYLLPNDAARRSAWADWAMRRADAFDDEALRERAIALHLEATRIELGKPENRSPEAILNLARKAREKGVPEPEPSALAHLAFRLRLASARSAEDYEAIARDVAANLPPSRSPQNADENRRFDRYAEDPSAAYREADPSGRAALDRKLWADATVESYRIRAKDAAPERLLTLADEARKALPDRPRIAGDLRRRGLEANVENVPNLRRAEMLELARTYREDLGQPEKARDIQRTWLDAKQARLSPTSADERTELAKDYFGVLTDKATAATLLRKALEIEPGNRDAVDQLQRMGFVKVGESWRDPQQAGNPDMPPASPAPGELSDDAFLGLTPPEVRAQLGEPKRTSRVASQGRISIQWTYETAKGTQYVDFLQKIGEVQPTVIGRYVVR